MTGDLLAEHDLGDGATLSLTRPRRGPAAYRLSTPLPGTGHETGWPFDGVSIRPQEIVLTRDHGRRPSEPVASGYLDGGPADYGAVGAALKLIAHGQVPRPTEVPEP